MRGCDQRSILFTLNGVPIVEPYNGITNPNLFPLDGCEIWVRGANDVEAAS